MKVTVPEGKTLEKDIVMNEGVELQEVQVKGAFQGQKKAINTQKNNLGINASKYREKTKRKLRRIAKKANGCVSLAAVQKDCRIKKSDFIKLLGSLRRWEWASLATNIEGLTTMFSPR